jgi:hypothetical protein
MGTRFSTELSSSSWDAVPTTLKKRRDVPELPGVLINSVTLLSASNFVEPYGEIGASGPFS